MTTTQTQPAAPRQAVTVPAEHSELYLELLSALACYRTLTLFDGEGRYRRLLQLYRHHVDQHDLPLPQDYVGRKALLLAGTTT